MPDEMTEPDQTVTANAEPEAGDGKANREAAKYRRQLREVEAERDALREKVSVIHRGEVERLAAGKLRDPGDLWVAGIDVAALLGDDGAPDVEKVDAAVTEVLVEHPGWASSRRPSPDPSQGHENAHHEGASTWADALRGVQ